MKRQQSLQHRLQTLSALQDAVGAMRSLSAHHFRRARQSLQAARTYRSEMDTIVAEIGIHQRPHLDRADGLLVVASDLGLCGDYNSRLAQLAVSEAAKHYSEIVYSLGHRVRGALAKQSIIPTQTYDAPASLEGLSQRLLGLAEDVMDDYTSEKIGSLHVVSASFGGVGHFDVVSTRVLPIDPIAGTSPMGRSRYVNSDYLTGVAVREYLYITLFEILLDALAAEQGMRLMAAESALEWLDGTVVATERRLNIARNEIATQELLDIVAGGRKRSATV